MTLKDKACIVGIGTTKFYRHGAAGDVTFLELMCQAAKNATEDAGIEIADIDGFSYYSGGTTLASWPRPSASLSSSTRS